MATLTWQDVAGYVRGPDTSDASHLITQGIEQLGTGVRALGEAPEQRRQADLAKQLLIATTARQGSREQAQMAAELGNVLKTERKEKDAEEFNTVRSRLEAGIRQHVANGGTMDDFLANSQDYAGLDDGARAFAAGILSDAAYQGETQRAQREREERMAEQFNRQLAQSAAQHAQNIRLQERRLEDVLRKERERDKKERLENGIYSDNPVTQAAIEARMHQTAAQRAAIDRGIKLYNDMGPAEAAKKGPLGNVFWDVDQEALRIAADVEKRTGSKVDAWMVNQLLAEGGGADNFILNPAGGIDSSRARDYLSTLVRVRDAANANQEYLNRIIKMASSGQNFRVEDLAPLEMGVELPEIEEPKPNNWSPRNGGGRGMMY